MAPGAKVVLVGSLSPGGAQGPRGRIRGQAREAKGVGLKLRGSCLKQEESGGVRRRPSEESVGVPAGLSSTFTSPGMESPPPRLFLWLLSIRRGVLMWLFAPVQVRGQISWCTAWILGGTCG